jgi:arginine deiminase
VDVSSTASAPTARRPTSTAAYGGAGWSPRIASLQEEIGVIWAACGVSTEYDPLEAVLLHRPGAELEQIHDPNTMQLLAPLDLGRAQAQHDRLAQAYREAGVAVDYVNPSEQTPPNMMFANLMFVADLVFMTPEGAILARPASTVRAGEERFVARRLAQLDIPILCSLRGRGVFEGADAAWINPQTVLLATGLRTNAEGAAQTTALLNQMGVEIVRVGLPHGAMHLMGLLRFIDRDLAIGWPGRIPYAAVKALSAWGYAVHFLPEESEEEAIRGMALNFVTLGPREILMPAGNLITQRFYEGLGVACHTVNVSELVKAAGGIGCLTGILARTNVVCPQHPAAM